MKIFVFDIKSVIFWFTYIIIILYLVFSVKGGISLKRLIKFMAKVPIFGYSAQVAFYFLMSLFPFLYLLTRLTAVFSISSDKILNMIYFIFPEVTYELIYKNLYTLTAPSNPYTLWLYIILCLWSSSMLINSLKRIFAGGGSLPAPKRIILRRATSIVITLVMAVAILFSLFATLAANIIVSFLTSYVKIKYFANLISLAISFGVAVIDFTLIYIFIPSKPIKFTEAIPGALFATVGYSVSSYLYSYYITYISDYSKLYGAMGSIILLLVWLYISSMILILGGFINKFFISLKEE